MDDVDVKICLMLLQNSRSPYRDIADRLELSVNAVHRRIQKLVETRVIRGFTTNLRLSYFGAMNLIIFGHSSSQQPTLVTESFREDRHTYWFGIAGGNELYIGAYLQNIQELDSYVNKVQQLAEIPSPMVGIIGYDSGQKQMPDKSTDLDRTDFRILSVLQTDSRRPLSEVAEELSLSAKTVRRRLERMEEQDLLLHSIKWYPEASNDIISVYQLRLPAGVDRNETGIELIRQYHPNALFFWSFSNIPNFLMLMSWHPKMRDTMDFQMALRKSSNIDNVMANIIYSGHVFETWREHFIRQQLK